MHLVVLGKLLGWLGATIVVVFIWSVVVRSVGPSIRDEERLALVVRLVHHGRQLELLLME